MRSSSIAVALMVACFAAAMADVRRVSLNDAPQNAASRTNPFADRSGAAAAGHKLFVRHCGECHGADAYGSRTAPSLRTPYVENALPGQLFWFVTNGNLRHGMPSWSRIPDERRWQIVTYLQSLRSSRQ